MTSAHEWRQYAQKLHDLGVNIVPLGGDKKPVIAKIMDSGTLVHFQWEGWKTTRQTDRNFEDIRKPAWWRDVRGLGAICGSVSQGLVCVDFDLPTGVIGDFPRAVIDTFLQTLGEVSPWVVRTPRGGWHVWLRCDALDLNDKGKIDRAAKDLPKGHHIEIRWTGHYAVLPGSAHPDVQDKLYELVAGSMDQLPSEVSAADLLAAYDAVTEEETEPAPAPKTVKGAAAVHRNGTGERAYVFGALEQECSEVAATSEGNRNERLNKAAYNLGGYLHLADASDRARIESQLLDAALAAGLSEKEARATIASGLNKGEKEPRYPNIQGPTMHVNGTGPVPDPEDLEEKTGHNPWPYGIENGRIVYRFESKEGIEYKPVADFTARIVAESTDEWDGKTFTIAGEGKRGGPFRFDIAAADYGSPGKLAAAFEAISPYDAIYNKMEGHLRPAIKALTHGDIEKRRHYDRTGWAGDKFLIAGNVPNGVTLDLPRKLPYAIDHDGDLAKGLEALRHLIEAAGPTRATVLLSHLFVAPAAHLAGWRGNKSLLAIIGRTGSLKTSSTMVAMAIYGNEFLNDDALIKWGEGATHNAMLALAAQAGDMPFLIDNFKPNTGRGSNDFVSVAHAIIEGGTKDRLKRNSELQKSRPIHAWPLMTGEDMPTRDSASLARALHVDWPEGAVDLVKLTHAQRAAEHLPAVGAAWIRWLESEEGRRKAKEGGKALAAKRLDWNKQLKTDCPGSANIPRLATNLAVHEIAWYLVCQHPDLGPLAKEYLPHLRTGLLEGAVKLAGMTKEGREVDRFINGLRGALATGYAVLVRDPEHFAELEAKRLQDRIVGWLDQGRPMNPDIVYVFPDRAQHVVMAYTGDDLGGMSNQTLASQLEGQGVLAAKGKDGRNTLRRRFGGSDAPQVRCWCIKRGELLGEGDGDGEEAPQGGEAALQNLGL